MSISKRWCYTLNNYTDNEVEAAKKIECLYHVFGYEEGDNGTPHLQGFITFKGNKRLSALKKILSRAHWEVAKGTSAQAADYCRKDGNYWSTGTEPSPGKRTDLEVACEMLKQGQSLLSVATECPTTFVKFGRGLRDLKLILDRPHTPPGLRGIWYWGPPGVGKSRRARDEYPTAYLKGQNKWFDGYNGESAIILDDLDTNTLGHHLKIWADRYPCTGETKGGTVNLQHDVFVVTSNYPPSHFWPDDEEMQNAIERRFKITHMLSPYLGEFPITPNDESISLDRFN